MPNPPRTTVRGRSSPFRGEKAKATRGARFPLLWMFVWFS
jgi:hypothetical protein